MTREMLHVTQDTWNVTCDTWHLTGGGRWTFYQNFSSLAPTVWEWRCSEDFQYFQWMNEWTNEWKGVYITAPATLGLVIRFTRRNTTLVESEKCLYNFSASTKWNVFHTPTVLFRKVRLFHPHHTCPHPLVSKNQKPAKPIPHKSATPWKDGENIGKWGGHIMRAHL